jgi:hypothetical protein
MPCSTAAVLHADGRLARAWCLERREQRDEATQQLAAGEEDGHNVRVRQHEAQVVRGLQWRAVSARPVRLHHRCAETARACLSVVVKHDGAMRAVESGHRHAVRHRRRVRSIGLQMGAVSDATPALRPQRGHEPVGGRTR